MEPGKGRLRLLLTITFVESIATILIERGVYFFSKHELGFSDTMNLWLALVFGVAYVVGSLLSHPVAKRTQEKPLLAAALASQVIACVVLATWAPGCRAGVGRDVTVLFVFNTLLAFLYGVKWPLVESYVCANQSPVEVARTLGKFNVCWSSAVPVSLALAGPLIGWRQEQWHGASLFAVSAALTGLAFLLTWPLSRHVEHMPPDHPDRPPAILIPRYRALLIASRSQMLLSYSAMWILAALLPGVFDRFGVRLAAATALSAVMDVARLGTFYTLGRHKGWHNRSGMLAAAMIALPAGFVAVLYWPHLAPVLAGEVVFGVGAGMVYFASLYYAMVVKNASVDAGGWHEALIGAGFAVGPACGLLGPLGVAPLLGVCAAVTIWAMARARRARPRE